MSPAVSPRQAGIRLSAAVEASFMKALRSNEPLSDLDLALFTRKIFSKAADNLSSLDDQISGLRASLDALTERRGRLQETLDHWRGVVSPMRTLPNEILTEIFMHVCRSFDVPQESDGPWLLCRVCTRWKALLLGTPALWAIFSLDAMRYGASPQSLPMLRKAVSLSASSPLTFFYRAETPYSEMPKAEADAVRCETIEILGVLSAQASRWVDVTLSLPRRVLPLLDRLNGCLPLLETLHLDYEEDVDPEEEDEDEDEDDYPLILGFQIAPHLTKVTLDYEMIEAVDLPLHQLLYLELNWNLQDGPGVAFDRLHYLNECPNLVELRVVHDFPVEEEWSQLRALAPANPYNINKSICVLHVSDDRFIRSLSLPALQELYITSLDEGKWGSGCPCPSAVVEGVSQMLQQSRCLLKSLKLMDCRAFVDIRTVLGAAPQLEHLELRYERWNDHCDTCLILLLSHLATTPTVAPNLRTLVIHVRDARSLGAKIRFVGVEFGLFVAKRFSTLGNRVSAPSCIEKIEVLFRLPVELRGSPQLPEQWDMLDKLRRVKQQGLNISITGIGVFPSEGRADFLCAPKYGDYGSREDSRFVYV